MQDAVGGLHHGEKLAFAGCSGVRAVAGDTDDTGPFSEETVRAEHAHAMSGLEPAERRSPSEDE